MHFRKGWFVFLAVSFAVLVLVAKGDDKKPANDNAKPATTAAVVPAAAPTPKVASASSTTLPAAAAKPAPALATEEEVEALRAEVAELKAIIAKLVPASPPVTSTTSGFSITGGAAAIPAPAPVPTEEYVSTDSEITEAGLLQTKDKKPEPIPFQAGWNGEHFFLRTGDGRFQIQPYGYFQTDFRAYGVGDGVPPNTFVIRRARFGFQGNFGTHFDYAVLLDSAATSGSVLRDLFLNMKIWPEFQIQAGQYKEPFAQEELLAVTNIDFVERSLASLLYPSASTAYRSPGATVHGDLWKSSVQYWVSAFNGKGIGQLNTTSEPEVIGRLRFSPWKNKKGAFLQGFSFGGAIAHGRTRGLSNETSFSAVDPDFAFTFFPSFRVNGSNERYNGEFALIHGPWAVRGEYNQLNQHRDFVGTETLGGIGFQSLPGVVARAGYIQGTYLVTHEARPENGAPKVKHPLFGPQTPGESGGNGFGAFELKFRYDAIQAKAGGAFFPSTVTPQFFPAFSARMDQFSAGVNWYPNYWIRYMMDFSVDRLRDPSVQGILPQNYLVVLQRLQFRF